MQSRGEAAGPAVVQSPLRQPMHAHLNDAAAHAKHAGAQPRKGAERWVEQGGAGRPLDIALQRLVARCALCTVLAQQVRPAKRDAAVMHAMPG